MDMRTELKKLYPTHIRQKMVIVMLIAMLIAMLICTFVTKIILNILMAYTQIYCVPWTSECAASNNF